MKPVEAITGATRSVEALSAIVKPAEAATDAVGQVEVSADAVKLVAAEPDVTKTVKAPAASDAVKRARSGTEDSGKELKRAHASDNANGQFGKSDGCVAEDERRSVMTELFSEEDDNTPTLTDVPPPYAGCNNPDAQHHACSLTALVDYDDTDDEYGDTF